MAKCPCGEPSVPGLRTPIKLCQKHFDDLVYGHPLGKKSWEARAIYIQQIPPGCKRFHLLERKKGV